MDKPLCLKIEDAKIELAAVINRLKKDYGLPCFIIEPILKDYYSQIANGKAVELEIVRKNYEAEQKKTEEGATDDGSGT